jgi:hypothetical protein
MSSEKKLRKQEMKYSLSGRAEKLKKQALLRKLKEL